MMGIHQICYGYGWWWGLVVVILVLLGNEVSQQWENLCLNLNLNLNSLLVKRQIDNPSPGAVTGGN